MEPEIEITPNMIRAGAGVIEADPLLDVDPFLAELLAERVLRAALECSQRQTVVTAP